MSGTTERNNRPAVDIIREVATRRILRFINEENYPLPEMTSIVMDRVIDVTVVTLMMDIRGDVRHHLGRALALFQR